MASAHTELVDFVAAARQRGTQVLFESKLLILNELSVLLIVQVKVLLQAVY